MEQANEKLLLFIPGYNCEKQIVRVLAQLDSEVLTYVSEVIMVNNRSTDGTEQAVRAYLEQHPALPLTLLRNDENYGLGGSHKVAFRYAREHGFAYVAVLHGDDQGSVRDLLPVLQSGAYRQHDCCLGARFMKGSALPGYSAFRTFGNRVYDALFGLVCRRRVYDLGSGLNLYRVSMLESNFYDKFPDDLTFNYCMVMALHCYEQSALFFPISWREEDQVSNVKLFSQAKRVLGMLTSYALHGARFLQSELRRTPRTAYTAQVIAASRAPASEEPASANSAPEKGARP